VTFKVLVIIFGPSDISLQNIVNKTHKTQEIKRPLPHSLCCIVWARELVIKIS